MLWVLARLVVLSSGTSCRACFAHSYIGSVGGHDDESESGRGEASTRETG